MLPTPEKMENEMFGKGTEMRRGGNINDKKESRQLWSFTWRRGSVDDGRSPDNFIPNSSHSMLDLPKHITSDRGKIWSDEFWQTSSNEQTPTRPTFNMTRRANSHDVASHYHNSVPPSPSGIHLLSSFQTVNIGRQNAQFQPGTWPDDAAEDPQSWGYTGEEAEDVQPKIITSRNRYEITCKPLESENVIDLVLAISFRLFALYPFCFRFCFRFCVYVAIYIAIFNFAFLYGV
jgi:hypothetical protein